MNAGDYAKALDIWQKNGDTDPRVLYSLGYLYQFGLGTGVDLARARDYYEKAAQQKNADATYALGLMYEAGKGVGRDLAQAMIYYRQAAGLGPHADAEYAIGRMYLRGRGVTRDPVEALPWLRKAADHGHPAAQYMLGAAYEAGWGVPPDKVEAYYWYSRAQQGDVVELEEQDMSFQPKIALESLRRTMSKEEIAAAKAKLRKTNGAPPPKPKK